MDTIACIGMEGPVLASNLEDPRLDLNDPRTWDDLLGGLTTASGVVVGAQTALAYPPLWRAINLISGDVGRLPLSIYRRTEDGGKEKAQDHPAYALLRRRPNPTMRASTFKRTLTFHALFHGNGYAAVIRDGRGVPRELLILDPEATGLAFVDENLWYVTMINGDVQRLPAADVIHIRGLSHDGLCGISVLDLMREALGLPIAAREYMARFFGNGSAQGGVLMVPHTFPDEKIANTLRTWNEMATGIAKSHRVALLKDNVKFIPTTVTPQNAQTTGILEHEIRTVAAITGCPPHKLGDASRTSYNSLEQENQSYLDDCLDPWLNEWEEEADLKLLTEAEQQSESHFHEFNRTARLRTDAAARGNFYKVLREIGVLSANDILRRENMPTIGAAGDVRFRPANWLPLEEANSEDSARRTARAHRRLIAGILESKGKIERAKILRAAEREPDFASWVVTFYEEHQHHLVCALSDAMRVVAAHSGRRVRWTHLVAAEVQDRCRQLREAAAPGRDRLTERVADILDRWSDDELVHALTHPTPSSRRDRCQTPPS